MNMMVLYVSYFLVVTSFLSESCVSAPMNSKCPHGTNCVFASSCPTVIRLIRQQKRNLVQEMYCEHEGGRAKVCCPSSETIIEFRTIETETYIYNKTADNEIDKITFPSDISTIDPYKSREYMTTRPYETKISPFPNKTICGLEKGSDKIVGGSIADIGEFPWLGRILYEVGSEKVFICGASLITNRYLLTAAHCLVESKRRHLVSVRLGEWDEDTERDCQNNYCSEKPVDIDIEKVFIYREQYNIKDLTSADIGLIKLKEPVKFTEFISPICLPDTEYIKMQEYAQSVPYWTTGWGTTEFGMPSTLKRKISLSGVSSRICQNLYKTYEMSLFDRVICAGGMEGRDSCTGDSGGPLMKEVEQDYQTNWYLFGITSFGPQKCGTEGRPSIYTKVSVYMDWIQRIVST